MRIAKDGFTISSVVIILLWNLLGGLPLSSRQLSPRKDLMELPNGQLLIVHVLNVTQAS